MNGWRDGPLDIDRYERGLSLLDAVLVTSTVIRLSATVV